MLFPRLNHIGVGERIELLRKTVSEIMFVLLLTSVFVLAFNIQPVKAEGIIYIRADGSIDPSNAPITTVDNITYTFMDTIIRCIEIERDSIIVDGAHNSVQGAEGGEAGIMLSGVTNVTIRNTTIKACCIGIKLVASSNNSIIGNNITANGNDGVELYSSSNNSIAENNITNNWAGVKLYYSSNNSIVGNNITANSIYGAGVLLFCSSSNGVTKNKITNNGYGILVYYYCSNNNIVGNNIVDSFCYGIWLGSSSNNFIYHNNFVNNTVQAYFYTSEANVWDNGYPSSGNYWSDYAGVDVKKGSGQDRLGSDGIGDTPYFIDVNNRDRYPFMEPWTSPAVATVDIDINTLNLKSRGEWVTAYIELPEGLDINHIKLLDGYDVNDIDASTIRLNGTIPAESEPKAIGDYDNNNIPDLMVKFNRTEVIEYILSEGIKFGNVTLILSGKFCDGTSFMGSDIVKASGLTGDVNCDGKVDLYDVIQAAFIYGWTEDMPSWDPNANFAPLWTRIDIYDIVTIVAHYGEKYP